MPVTLRTPNNPDTDVAILNVLKNVMHVNLALQPCTYLAQISTSQTGLELTYIQNKYQMALGMTATLPYGVHLSSGKQGYSKEGAGLRTYIGQLTCIIEYCARWDDQQSSIDSIRKTIAADLERIKANLESNDSMAYQGTAYSISIPSMQLGDYKGTLNYDYPGLTLVERTLTMTANILPYDCLV
jgi:hypothetical protein